MIRSFRHKGLARLFLDNDPSRVRSDLVKRCRIWLSALHRAERLSALHVPGFDFHSLRGRPQRLSLHVNGPWCITFEWRDGHAWRVDLEQDH
ncbi:MAG: type II toxin-antitoxin system RelE/ParE family toxin [Geminicoccaceae bacterium]